MTDSLVAISEVRSANALFAAGRVYQDRFEDTPQAAAAWTDLITRFPDMEIIPETYYNLYLLYRQSDQMRAENNRQALLTRFPDSDYARILTDPDYFRKQVEAENRTGRLYEEAYNAYREARYDASLTICSQILSTTQDHPLLPKVRLLNSLNLAGLQDERGYRESLTALVKTFPGSEEAIRASELLAVLNREMPELKVEEDRQIAAEIYYHEPEAQHLFVLLITNPGFNINQASFDVINYNIDNYTNRNFRAEGRLIDNKFVIVTVSRFSTSADAMEYFNGFNALTTVRNTSAATTMTFIITERNLDTLLADKDPARYMLFFREKYNINK